MIIHEYIGHLLPSIHEWPASGDQLRASEMRGEAENRVRGQIRVRVWNDIGSEQELGFQLVLQHAPPRCKRRSLGTVVGVRNSSSHDLTMPTRL
jgi:hypothetical protein